MTRHRRARCPSGGRPGDGTPCAPSCPPLEQDAPTATGLPLPPGSVEARLAQPHPASSVATPFVLNLPEEGLVALAPGGRTIPVQYDARFTDREETPDA